MIEDLNSFDYDDYACSCFLNVNQSDVLWIVSGGDIGDIFMFIYHDRFGYDFFELYKTSLPMWELVLVLGCHLHPRRLT